MEIQRKLNENGTEIEWKSRTDNERSVKGLIAIVYLENA